MLPFTAEALSALLANYNGALWPAQFAAYGIALTLVWVLVRPRAGGTRFALAVLAAGWAWTGAVFHLMHFATINFWAPVEGALFLVQALLLTRMAAIGGRITRAAGSGSPIWIGLGFVAWALVAYPLIAAGAGGGVASAPVVGLAPGPTAVFTLGVLLLAAGRTPLHLIAIPVLWCLIAGATAWQLGVTADLPLPVLALAALALAVHKNRRSQGG